MLKLIFTYIFAAALLVACIIVMGRFLGVALSSYTWEQARPEIVMAAFVAGLALVLLATLHKETTEHV